MPTNPNPSAGSLTYNLRFPGQLYDSITATHHNGAREYDPRVGRYLQADPIGLGGGLSRYAYVGGDPLSFSDPLGLLPSFMVPKDVKNNVQGFVNTVTGNTLTSQQLAALTNQVISEISFGQAAQLNGIKNSIPVALTQQQAAIIADVINNLAAQNPNDPVIQQVAKQLPGILQNPNFCKIK